MHHHTEKIDRRHTVRTEGVRRNDVGTVLKSSSHEEKHWNQKCLNEDSRLKEEPAKDWIDGAEYIGQLPVLKISDVRFENDIECTYR